MAKSDSVKDRRKYQRVLVEPSSKVLQVTVTDYGPTLVFDMSYEGAAFAQPKERKVESVDQPIRLHLKTDVDEAAIAAKTVRVSDEVVAVHFKDISVAARIIIDRVVTDRIVGLNMALIDPKHYSAGADFSFWFHGPKDTNLYLWMQEGELVKAQMDMSGSSMVMDEDMILFENKKSGEGVPVLNNQQIALKVYSIIRQIESELPALVRFKEKVKEHVEA
jgi:hypothetical protein